MGSAGCVAYLFDRKGIFSIKAEGVDEDTLMAIALELINRGPTTISIEGVESFRTKVLHLLSQIRPVIEHEAKVSLADWTDRLAAEPQGQRRAA